MKESTRRGITFPESTTEEARQLSWAGESTFSALCRASVDMQLWLYKAGLLDELKARKGASECR